MGPLAYSGRAPHRGLDRDRPDDLDRESSVPLVVPVETPGDGRPHVVGLDDEPGAPRDLVGPAQTGADLLGEREIVLGVAAAPVVRRPGLVELLPRVLPERLEQVVARRAVFGAFGDDHRLGDEARQRVEHVKALDPVTTDHSGRRGAVEAPGEHTESVEHEAFPLVEESVGPVDGGP